ncbi:MAG: hypothetical protein NTW04_02940 [Elusimicrobia bacterium]|nr:hypothetical protein [Elusimicrobiota bacterium]
MTDERILLQIRNEIHGIRVLLETADVGVMARLKKLETIVCGNGKAGLAEKVRALQGKWAVGITAVSTGLSYAVPKFISHLFGPK